LADHKDTLGAPLCPCRHYEDKEAEVKNGFWNCPCVPMRERKECHCMLFLTEDNPFPSGNATISLEDVSREIEGGGPERRALPGARTRLPAFSASVATFV